MISSIYRHCYKCAVCTTSSYLGCVIKVLPNAGKEGASSVSDAEDRK